MPLFVYSCRRRVRKSWVIKPNEDDKTAIRHLTSIRFFFLRKLYRTILEKMCVKILKLCVFGCLITGIVFADKPTGKKEKSWKDKDVRDMSDADMERLLDQWEEGDDPLEPDELPEHLRPARKIDLSQIDTSNPDNILKATKQGKGVMMFVDVIPEKSVQEAEVIMKIWQSSLMNNHIIAERYPIDQKRSVFLFREGSQAVDAKNYLLEQPELAHLTLEGQTHEPKRSKQKKDNGRKKNKNTAKSEL